MRILNTFNYDMFELIKENRPIDWAKIKRMREKIKVKNLTSAYIIIVNSKKAGKERYNTEGEKYPIIDGQHRFISCQLENKKVYYQVNDSISLDDIPSAANMQNPWKLTDYLHHYCSKGVKEYQMFNKYMTDNEFPPSATLIILCGDRGSYVSSQFKHGQMEIIAKWKFAHEFARAIDEVGQFISFNKQARFVEAFLLAFENHEYNHERMMKKLEYASGHMKKMPDKRLHLEQLEWVYNYKSRSKVRLNIIRDIELS